jgi:hypothetical protein
LPLGRQYFPGFGASGRQAEFAVAERAERANFAHGSGAVSGHAMGAQKEAKLFQAPFTSSSSRHSGHGASQQDHRPAGDKYEDSESNQLGKEAVGLFSVGISVADKAANADAHGCYLFHFIPFSYH